MQVDRQTHKKELKGKLSATLLKLTAAAELNEEDTTLVLAELTAG